MAIEVRLTMHRTDLEPDDVAVVVAQVASDMSRFGKIGLFAAASDPPTLGLMLHPCATPMWLEIRSGIGVLLEAATSKLGPGYHEHVIDFARSAARELGASLSERDDGDETGFFTSGDREALEASMMRWLFGLASLEDAKNGSANSQILLPPDRLFPAEPGMTVTPWGPRDRKYFQRILKDPAAARDFFSWWDRDPTPRDTLRAAIGVMWTGISWAPPETDSDRDIMMYALELLNAAYAAAPDAEYPWREWLELITLVDPSASNREVIAERAAVASGPLIGYLRTGVIVDFDTFTMLVPAGLTEVQQPGTTFAAEGSGCSMRLNVRWARTRSGTPEPMQAIAAEFASLDEGSGVHRLDRIDEADRVSRGVWTRSDTGRISVISYTAIEGRLLALTFDLPDESRLEMVERVRRSIQPQEPRRSVTVVNGWLADWSEPFG